MAEIQMCNQSQDKEKETNVLLKEMKVIQMEMDNIVKQQGGWVVQITGKASDRGT